jgi:hypothetical protein
VIVDGREYPARLSVGAMFRYEEQTGKKVQSMTGSVSETARLIYCMTLSACERDKVEFNMTFMEFCDALSAEDLEQWSVALTSAGDDTQSTDKKKH